MCRLHQLINIPPERRRHSFDVDSSTRTFLFEKMKNMKERTPSTEDRTPWVNVCTLLATSFIVTQTVKTVRGGQPLSDAIYFSSQTRAHLYPSVRQSTCLLPAFGLLLLLRRPPCLPLIERTTWCSFPTVKTGRYSPVFQRRQREHNLRCPCQYGAVPSI